MSRDVGELAELRRELRDYRMYVDDDALRERIGDWIEESLAQSEADTARQFVEEKLNALLDGQPMYNSPAVSRGEDAFPDACEGCPHYGAACPVVTDRTEQRWRTRKLEEAESEQEARRVFEQQARDVDCHRIPAFLESWDNDHRALLERGQRLQSKAEDLLHATAGEDVELEDDATALAVGGGEQ
ncbi:hypothetical protein [Halorubellus salinus]|uniref:hypothetical protein n=1 Tax=Halorubellus salinus TaxID=755309 RepID=UPI001D06CD8C|nr:hypothetical protein [Halorubellus salinus]